LAHAIAAQTQHHTKAMARAKSPTAEIHNEKIDAKDLELRAIALICQKLTSQQNQVK